MKKKLNDDDELRDQRTCENAELLCSLKIVLFDGQSWQIVSFT